MKTFILYLSVLFLSFRVLAGETLFELVFPYATKWTHPEYGGLGNGMGDFDLDGKQNDAVRGATFGSPTSEEYRTPMNFTEKGPVFKMRSMAAGLNVPEESEPPFVGAHGVTRHSFRMEATRDKSPKYEKMGYAGWLLFDAGQFGKAAQLSQPLSVEIEFENKDKMSVRLLVKSKGLFFVSEAVSEGHELKIPNLATASFIEYKQAEKGRSLRLIPQNGSKGQGGQLGNLEGIGVYVEKASYDGNKHQNPRLELTQLKLLR